MNRSQRIAAQLGMPHGTAANKLRKRIMFSYVQKAGDNFCHVCGAEIESVDDLSIEHIEPWEGRDADLFWSLENITFSHRECNRPHEYNRAPVNAGWNKKAKDGEYWCWSCQKSLSKDAFSRNKTAYNGVESVCRSCRSRRRVRKEN